MELILGGEAVGEEVLLEVRHLVEVVAVLLEMVHLFQLLYRPGGGNGGVEGTGGGGSEACLYSYIIDYNYNSMFINITQ